MENTVAVIALIISSGLSQQGICFAIEGTA